MVSKQEEAEAAWRELAEAKETVAVQAKQLSQAEALASRSEVSLTPSDKASDVYVSLIAVKCERVLTCRD